MLLARTATANGFKLNSPQNLRLSGQSREYNIHTAARYLFVPRYSFEAFGVQWGFSVILNNAHI